MQIGIKADQQKIPDWWAIPVSAHLRKRRAKEKMTIFAGQTAVCFSVSMLAILISVLIFTGSSAFFKTHVIVEVSIPQNFALIDPYEANYRSVVFEGLYRLFPNVTSRRGKRGLQKILSQNSPYLLRNYVQRNNDLIGKTFVFDVPMSDRYSQMYKSLRKGGDVIGKKGESIQIKRLLTLRGMEVITRKFNTGLFKNADSRLPETAGLLGAIKGSFMTLLVCFSFSFPVGIGAGIFLQEMLRKGPIANFIEINSNNLAAVPSVVFGLLSLSILLNTFGLPRSSALVGGITLAIMT
jgi:phosphate transport system permease protein